MATNFPTSEDDATTVGGDGLPAPTTALSDSVSGHPSHSDLHENLGDAVQAIEAKLGTGSGGAVSNSLLAGTGSGTSGWSTDPTVSGTVTAGGLTVDTDTLHVDATNNRVGIGTTSPDEELEVQGAGNTFAKIYTSSSTGQAGVTLHVDTDTTANDYWTIFQSDGTGHDLRFSSGNTANAVTFDTDGNVGIGTTAPNSQLEVVSTSQRAFKLDRAEDVASGGVTCGIMQIGTDATNPGTDDYWILFRRGSDTTIGSVRGTGSASVNFSTTSDATLKTDRGIATASRVGTIIDGLQVHEFDWNEGDVTNQIGLFAQEAMPHLPDSIVADSDTDEEGNYIPASLDYSKIVPILIAEIQFLRGRLAALEAA